MNAAKDARQPDSLSRLPVLLKESTMQTKQKPKSPTDVAMSAAINIAKLLVQEGWTPQTYREQREYVNSLPGVRIVSLPRDEEFGYVEAGQ